MHDINPYLIDVVPAGSRELANIAGRTFAEYQERLVLGEYLVVAVRHNVPDSERWAEYIDNEAELLDFQGRFIQGDLICDGYFATTTAPVIEEEAVVEAEIASEIEAAAETAAEVEAEPTIMSGFMEAETLDSAYSENQEEIADNIETATSSRRKRS